MLSSCKKQSGVPVPTSEFDQCDTKQSNIETMLDAKLLESY
jgi:hypothetical protein